jgi:hypothetical protein
MGGGREVRTRWRQACRGMNAEPWVALFAWLRMLRILAWSGSAAAMPMIGLNPANASSLRVIARRVLDDFDDEEAAQALWSDSNGTVQSISKEMARADRSDDIDQAVRRLFLFSARFYREVLPVGHLLLEAGEVETDRLP